MGIKQWKLPDCDRELADRLAAETGRPALLCRILVARGVTEASAVERFFEQDAPLDDPFLLADMAPAVERIQAAIEQGERICVYGDYDCDGMTSTALLTSYLQSVGADVIYYIPGREKEGYGLNIASIDMLSGQGVGLIVTVDNGISAHEEIAHAATLGIEVIVTDHHTPRDTLPGAVAVVNPHRADCPSRYKDLAGVGVAFKLICALEGDSGAELLEYYSDIVAIGTVADIVPLTGENRTIVRHGLARLPETGSPGIAALIEVAGLSGKALSGESIAFGIAPRINAAGRVGVADDIVELLLTDDAATAAETAALVDGQNTHRKKIEADILAEIERMLEENPQILKERVLIVAGSGWHHGVVGIVTAKLVERYEKPSLVLSVDAGEARGSGRSIKGFSLIEAITACSGRLTRYGGHTLAAGVTLPEAEITAFCAEMQAFAKEHHPVMPAPVLEADCAILPRELSIETIAQLSGLEPFGAGNETPLFHIAGLTIQGVYPIGDNKHIRIRFSAEGTSFYAVYFGVTEQAFPHRPGEEVEILARVSVQQYNGKDQLSVKIADLRPPAVPQEQVLLGRERYARFLREEPLDAASAAEMLPSREDIAAVYRFLRKAGTYPGGADGVYWQLMHAGADYARVRLSLDVLVEMGLVRGDSANSFTVLPDAPKADLADSAILAALRGEKIKTHA